MGLRSPGQLLNREPTASPNLPAATAMPVQVDMSGVKELGQILDRRIREEAIERRQRRKTAEDLAVSAFENQADLELVEAEQKVLSSQGLNVADVSNKQQERLQGRLQETYNNSMRFATPEARARGALALQKKMGQFQRNSIKHGYSEARKLEESTFKSRVSNDMESAVLNSGDIDYLEGEGLEAVRESVLRDGFRRYGPNENVVLPSGQTVAEALKFEVLATQSDVVKRSVQSQIASGNLVGAFQLRERLGDTLTAADRVVVDKALESAEEDNTTNLATAVVFKAREVSDGDEAAAIEYIKNHSVNGKVYSSAIRLFNTEEVVNKRLREQEQVKKENAITQEFLDTGKINMQAVNRDIPARERDAFLEKLRKQSSPGTAGIVTDYRTLDNIYTQMAGMTAEQISKFNVDDYRHVLSPEDYNSLTMRKRNAQQQMSGNLTKVQTYNESIISRVVSDVEVYAKSKGLKVGSGERRDLQLGVRKIYEDLFQSGKAKNETELFNMVVTLSRMQYVKNQSRGVLNPRRYTQGLIDETEFETNQDFSSNASGHIPSGRDEAWVIRVQGEARRRGRRLFSDSELDLVSEGYRKRGQ